MKRMPEFTMVTWASLRKSAGVLFLVCIIPSSSISWAATRQSADYAVAADALDDGGGASSGGIYANLGSVGGVGGVTSVVSPSLVAKAGYPAQIFEVTSLSIGPDPATVNEGESQQLLASAVLDDNTYLEIAGVHWEIINGPLDAIDVNGLATAGIVYEDSPAQVQGSYMGGFGLANLTVLNVGSDDFGSYGGDGLDDAWQVLYYGENNPDAGPGMDSDNDKQNTEFEFYAGTDPTDPLSFFRLTIDRVEDEPDQRAIIFNPRYADRTYTVEKRASLIDGIFSTLSGIAISDDGEERTVIDLDATDPEKYYRVKIQF